MALLSLTANLSPEYRSGCILVPDPQSPAQVELVSRDGTRAPCELADAEAYARLAAEEFGVNRETAKKTFDWKIAKRSILEKKGKTDKEG